MKRMQEDSIVTHFNITEYHCLERQGSCELSKSAERGSRWQRVWILRIACIAFVCVSAKEHSRLNVWMERHLVCLCPSYIRISQDWLRHFIPSTKPTVEDHDLLMLDGRYWQQTLTLLNKRKKIIFMFSFRRRRPHIKYLPNLQSNDIIHSRLSRVLTVRQVGKLFGSSYLQTATVEMVVNEFKKWNISTEPRRVQNSWFW
jgi:hypothetical protein